MRKCPGPYKPTGCLEAGDPEPRPLPQRLRGAVRALRALGAGALRAPARHTGPRRTEKPENGPKMDLVAVPVKPAKKGDCLSQKRTQPSAVRRFGDLEW